METPQNQPAQLQGGFQVELSAGRAQVQHHWSPCAGCFQMLVLSTPSISIPAREQE